MKRDPRRKETEAWKPNRAYKNGEESCPTALIQSKIVKYNDPYISPRRLDLIKRAQLLHHL